MRKKELDISEKLCKKLKSIKETKEVLESLVDICEKKSDHAQYVQYKIGSDIFLNSKVKKELRKYGSIGFSKKSGTWIMRYEPENYFYNYDFSGVACMVGYVYLTRVNFLETEGGK